MSSTLQTDLVIGPSRRYSNVALQKSAGSTYTPDVLASFVAKQILNVANLQAHGPIRLLDPAVGDGALLEALIGEVPPSVRRRLEVFGFDTNVEALELAKTRLTRLLLGHQLRLEKVDFLEHVLCRYGTPDLLSSEIGPKFDLVIANPPYVRTQVMGASQAQLLAETFGLTGRIDLYHPFLLGIARVLAPDGVAGIITSNRFMSTKSGQAVRRAVLSQFDVVQAWDLGDTKLFDAAVLPAVLLAHGRAAVNHDCSTAGIRFSSAYETKDAADNFAGDPLAALSASDDSVVSLPDGRRFRIRHGKLDNGGNADGVWRVATQATDKWLATVDSKTWGTFRRIGKIRVGVKSTADKVFIRNDWNSLPGGRPELLRPLVTRHAARRYRACVPANANHVKEILYPHEVLESGRRRAADLTNYPRAKQYLEANRAVLEARTYVIEAGRAWYELWVPQDPGAWSNPKLVFPDISDKPVFWMDTDGGVINGECYWLQAENPLEADLLWLALAIANSSFIVSFYDHRFNNKLYAGRRRFITQYVEQFPLPDPALASSMEIVAMTRQIYALTPSPGAEGMARQLDSLIWAAFGLQAEKEAS